MAKDLTTYDDMIDTDEWNMGLSGVSNSMMMLFMLVLVAAIVPTMQATQQIAQGIQAQTYVGLTDTKVLSATSQLQWLNLVSDPPYTPWVTASFFNDGPSSVFIAINNPDELLELKVGDQRDVNTVGATRRIEFVFYKAYPGLTAKVRVDGKY